MRSWSVIGGMLALGLGIFGIYDEYFTVIEFLKGAIQPITALLGLVSILAGLLTAKPKIGHVVFGVAMVALGTYGFFDEYYATLDFFKGSVPLLMLLIGMVAVVSGVKQLK
jgi:hypothetical protein